MKEKYPSAKTGIGSNVTKVQKEFSKVFNYTEDDLSTDGSQFDVLFKDGDTLKLGEIEGRVIYTPGHTPACVCYVLGDSVFTGDVSIHTQNIYFVDTTLLLAILMSTCAILFNLNTVTSCDEDYFHARFWYG